jgi:hypothetical protein
LPRVTERWSGLKISSALAKSKERPTGSFAISSPETTGPRRCLLPFSWNNQPAFHFEPCLSESKRGVTKYNVPFICSNANSESLDRSWPILSAPFSRFVAPLSWNWRSGISEYSRKPLRLSGRAKHPDCEILFRIDWAAWSTSLLSMAGHLHHEPIPKCQELVGAS